MSIKPLSVTAPHPNTQRGQASHLTYDSVNDRLAYTNGKSIIIRPADFKSNSPIIVFPKHNHITTAVKFSPSGNYIASGDESGQVKIWDAAPKKGDENFNVPVIKSEFQIISGPIKSIAWDADNSRIIAVGQGKEKFGHAFSWDSGNSIGDIQGHSSTINAVDIKPQRPYRAATVSDDFAMVFFQGPPFKFEKSLRGLHSNVVRDVKFSPNGDFIVSVGSDRVICLYEGKTGEFIKKIEKAHEGGIFAVQWAPDSKYFITASADGSLKKWSINDGVAVTTYNSVETPTIDNQQVGLAITKDYVLSLNSNGDLNYFDENGELIKVVQGNRAPITKILLENDTLLSGSSDGKIFKYKIDEEGLEALPTLQGSKEEEHSNYVVDILSENSVNYTIGWDDKLKVWENGKVTNSIDLPSQPKQLEKIGTSIIVLFESEIQLHDLSLQLQTDYKLKFPTTCVAPLSNSTFLITNIASNTIVEYKISDNNITQSDKEFPKLRSPPTLIKVSPNGEYVAVADSTGKYTLYKSDGSVITSRWAFHTSKVYDAQWTKDSKYLISGGLDTGLLLYSVEKPSKVIKFPLAHSAAVTSLAWKKFDGDKKIGTFISSGLDGTIRTWEITS
ncbi:AIP1 [Candida pseudojiufengensis]|uniref:AIP1 n=1 Tax=Candida pseudojiufengensis TaxID=497109 RepID=UPI002224C9A7|nr:AIP1 [Candida pseudojiufengensis]KAI5963605.1 AIP1 [Candida pseudojiufengensis]